MSNKENNFDSKIAHVFLSVLDVAPELDNKKGDLRSTLEIVKTGNVTFNMIYQEMMAQNKI